MAGRNKRKSDADNESLMELVPKETLQIVSITCDNKGNVMGLGNNGKLYKYNSDNREWVML
jgi:hypothetical protein